MGKPMTKEETARSSMERLESANQAGFKYVQVLGCGNPGEDCEACLAMQDQKIEIEFATPLPLPGCDKEFCKCVYLAAE